MTLAFDMASTAKLRMPCAGGTRRRDTSCRGSNESLRRDFAFTALAALAVDVAQAQALAFEQGAGQQREAVEPGAAPGGMQDADAPRDFVGASSLLPSRVVSRASRGDMRPEQTRLHVFEQVLHGQQGVDFGGIEPQPRQLVARGLALGRGEAVAAGLAVVTIGALSRSRRYYRSRVRVARETPSSACSAAKVTQARSLMIWSMR